MAGFKNALAVFQHAAKQVPAYKALLKQRGVNASKIKTEADFLRVPVIEKADYIYQNDPYQLFPQGKMPALIYASSGSSGKPTFWFRGDAEEKTAGKLHEQIFREIYGIKKNEPTLVMICFSMGLWIAGGITYAACREITRMGYNLTSITPGLEKGDILNSLEKLHSKFKHIVIAGYPPFIMDVLVDADKRHIPLDKVRVLTAGDKSSEGWRDQVVKLTGHKDMLRTVVNVYGCADAGMLGFETPLTVFLRRVALGNKDLAQELFDGDANKAAVVQYDPDKIYFEKVEDELVFTVNTGIPLVRYNLHDLGNILQFADIAALFKKHGLEKEAKKVGAQWHKWPVLVKFGRTDVAVTTYALNIFPEHIRAGLEDKKIAKLVTGNYIAYSKSVQNHKKEELHFDIELAAGVTASKTLQQKIADTLVQVLTKVNFDYRKLYEKIGDRALPVVKLLQFGKGVPVSAGTRSLLNIQGKKPRMVLP